MFVSLHQWPLYPGTGWYDETGVGEGVGFTMNIPLPPQTTGDVYLAAFDQLILPISEKFEPTWLIVSAGFDAHRNDPITQMGLSSGDYPLMMQRLMQLVPAGRRLVMLEGGYDLDALRMSTASTLAAMVGVHHSDEQPTTGGPAESVDQLATITTHWQDLI